MVQHLVVMPTTTVAPTRSAPLAIVRVVIPMVPMIIAVCPITPMGPVSIPIIPVRSTVVTVGSSIVTVVHIIVVSSTAGVATTVIRWVPGIVPTMRPGGQSKFLGTVW